MSECYGMSRLYSDDELEMMRCKGESEIADELSRMYSANLSIAELAAQRGMEPRDVAINILESNGFKRAIDGNRSWLQIHVCDKTYMAGVDYEKVTMEGPNKNEFTLPYTAVTPALIKAVCGGGE